MKRAKCASLQAGLLGLWGIAVAVAGDSPAPDLARCAAIAKAKERLACYDALAGRTPADDKQDFGITKSSQSAVAKDNQAIQARVTRVGFGQLGQKSLALDNGQTWLVTEGDARAESGDLVTIRRAALGSFLMTTPSTRTYRVRRTQ